MVRITVVVDRDGLVRRIGSAGHARRFFRPAGACGIASHALRSFGRVVAAKGSLAVSGKADRPGRFEMVIGEVSVGDRPWYRGVCDVLIQGLGDVQRDFPGQVDMNIITSEQETRNGS
jgi:hypothetical protein